jgi:beta-glucanase (GH16 family)
MQKVNNVWKKLSYNSSTGAWLVDNTTLTTGNTKNIYLDKDNNDLYYWNGSAFTLLSEDKV